MTIIRNSVLSLLSVGLLGIGTAGTDELVHAPPSSESEQIVIRVLYLEGMDPREAVTLLRRHVQVRRVATISGRSLVVVADTLQRVEQAEKLLQHEKNAVSRSVDPHAPLDLERLSEVQPATKTFEVGSANLGPTTTILRAIYQVREVAGSAETGSVTARAAQTVLDSSEALLRELGLIIE
jgi:type II secretory pathway component GspD/PulD (secretin)